MKFIFNSIILLISSFTLFSCNDASLNTTEIQTEKVFSKRDFHTIDSFNLRVNNFLMELNDAEYFALIDYKTSAKCSDDKIVDFFAELSPTKNISIVFNDSSTYNNYYEAFPAVKWEFVESSLWEKLGIQSSNILEFKKSAGKYKRLN